MTRDQTSAALRAACVGVALGLALGCTGQPPKPRPRHALSHRAQVRRAAPARAIVASPGPRTRPRTRPRMAANVRIIQWTTRATAYRSRNGIRLTMGCPAGGQPSSVWGTGVYTDDSSICTAAVHAGLITLARGGIVTLEIAAGRASYAGSTQHSVASSRWGRWNGSFLFVGSARPLPLRPWRRAGVPPTIPWNQTARHLRTQVGKRFTFLCSRFGSLSAVWGSSIYTDDSSICSAAVHAGYITVTGGGTVTMEIQSGQSAYQGTTRNGVKSANWRSWSGSFIFMVPTVPRVP